jgi:hypothetical protein
MAFDDDPKEIYSITEKITVFTDDVSVAEVRIDHLPLNGWEANGQYYVIYKRGISYLSLTK